MSTTRYSLRIAVGQALRRMRLQGRLSLDEVERITRGGGVRVTRSHLSRVETGQADLAVPRFLCLMRALGEPSSAAIERLDALLEPEPPAADELRREIERQRRSGRADAVARLMRRVASAGSDVLDAPLLSTWAAAEAALGRWRAAERILRREIDDPAANGVCLLRLALASVASGIPSLGGALARGLQPRHGLLATAVEAASRRAAGDAARAAELSSETAQKADDAEVAALALVLTAEAYFGTGQRRCALAIARKALVLTRSPVARAEALLTIARCAGGVQRPAHGLRHLNRALPLARSAGCPELVTRLHALAETLWRRAGDPGRARAASRVARTLRRRYGSDLGPALPLPLQSLWRTAEAAARRDRFDSTPDTDEPR
ncbi:MAG: hypothetical protein JSV80_05610 [Acidobacteriota bacterium]|nr:MAG: hypothetical protein JSV80_05610 [Acidobacteriota bacterium]